MSWKTPFKLRWVYGVGFLFSRFPVSALLLIWSNDFSVMRKKKPNNAPCNWLYYEFGRMKTQLGEKTLGVFMREFPDWTKWGEMTHSKCGYHHSMDWGTGLNTKYKGSELSSCFLLCSLLSDCRCHAASCLALTLPRLPSGVFTLWDQRQPSSLKVHSSGILL